MSNYQPTNDDLHLSGTQHTEFVSALLDAFPTQAALERLARAALGQEVVPYLGGLSPADYAESLLAWAEARDQVRPLLLGALGRNPTNRRLQAFAAAEGVAVPSLVVHRSASTSNSYRMGVSIALVMVALVVGMLAINSLLLSKPPQPSVIYGPVSGILTYNAGLSYFMPPSQIRVRDFITEVRFYNPHDLATGQWDCGIAFRYTAGDQRYQLEIRSNKQWYLKGDPADPSVVIAQGSVPNLDVSATGSNLLRLTAISDTATLTVNGAPVGTFRIAGRTDKGVVWIGTGMQPGYLVQNRATRFDSFSIWSLDP